MDGVCEEVTDTRDSDNKDFFVVCGIKSMKPTLSNLYMSMHLVVALSFFRYYSNTLDKNGQVISNDWHTAGGVSLTIFIFVVSRGMEWDRISSSSSIMRWVRERPRHRSFWIFSCQPVSSADDRRELGIQTVVND